MLYNFTMATLGNKIKLSSLLACVFFTVSLGGFSGHVLCLGTDGHMHTEITFNGIDCGHFPKTSSGSTAPDYLAKSHHPPPGNHCMCCLDIPLSSDCSLRTSDLTKTQRTSSKLRTISFLISPLPAHSPATASFAIPPKTRDHLPPALNLISTTVLLL